MVKVIETIDELIDAMGGTGEAARWAGTTDACVSNWRAREYLPSGYHLRALIWMNEHSYKAAPSLFGLNDGDVERVSLSPLSIESSTIERNA